MEVPAPKFEKGEKVYIFERDAYGLVKTMKFEKGRWIYVLKLSKYVYLEEDEFHLRHLWE